MFNLKMLSIFHAGILFAISWETPPKKQKQKIDEYFLLVNQVSKYIFIVHNYVFVLKIYKLLSHIRSIMGGNKLHFVSV